MNQALLFKPRKAKAKLISFSSLETLWPCPPAPNLPVRCGTIHHPLLWMLLFPSFQPCFHHHWPPRWSSSIHFCHSTIICSLNRKVGDVFDANMTILGPCLKPFSVSCNSQNEKTLTRSLVPRSHSCACSAPTLASLQFLTGALCPHLWLLLFPFNSSLQISGDTGRLWSWVSQFFPQWAPGLVEIETCNGTNNSKCVSLILDVCPRCFGSRGKKKSYVCQKYK